MEPDLDLDLDLSGGRRDDPTPGYVRRLRPVTWICAALAASVALLALLSWWLTRGLRRPIPGLPPAVPLALALLGAVLILLSSRLRSAVLRRAFPRSPGLPPRPDAVLAAYGRASLAAFAVLEAAGALGLLVSLTSGSGYFGLVLCAAAVLAMLTRWPRAAEVDRLLRGRARP